MKKFKDVIQCEVDNIAILPLLHTCDSYSLRKILDQMKLIPQLCDVFNIDLLYTYYGIPSYRTNYDKATRNPAYYPICLILETTKFNNFHKIYPFDSGAFKKKLQLKEQFFHHKTEIEDFELENTIESAMRIIKTFYQSNQNYIFEKPDKKKEFGYFDFEAHGYKNMILDPSNSEIDSRASSIEVIFDQEINLDRETVLQLIIPRNFKDDNEIMSLLKDKLNIEEPLSYGTFRGSPKEYFGQMRDEYIKFIQANRI